MRGLYLFISLFDRNENVPRLGRLRIYFLIQENHNGERTLTTMEQWTNSQCELRLFDLIKIDYFQTNNSLNLYHLLDIYKQLSKYQKKTYYVITILHGQEVRIWNCGIEKVHAGNPIYQEHYGQKGDSKVLMILERKNWYNLRHIRWNIAYNKSVFVIV